MTLTKKKEELNVKQNKKITHNLITSPSVTLKNKSCRGNRIAYSTMKPPTLSCNYFSILTFAYINYSHQEGERLKHRGRSWRRPKELWSWKQWLRNPESWSQQLRKEQSILSNVRCENENSTSNAENENSSSNTECSQLQRSGLHPVRLPRPAVFLYIEGSTEAAWFKMEKMTETL